MSTKMCTALSRCVAIAGIFETAAIWRTLSVGLGMSCCCCCCSLLFFVSVCVCMCSSWRDYRRRPLSLLAQESWPFFCCVWCLSQVLYGSTSHNSCVTLGCTPLSLCACVCFCEYPRLSFMESNYVQICVCIIIKSVCVCVCYFVGTAVFLPVY